MLQKLDFNFNDDQHIKSGALTLVQEDGYAMMLTVPGHEFWKGIFKDDEDREPSCVFVVKEIEPGIYQTGLNFEHNIRRLTDFEVYGNYDRLGKDGLPKKFDHEGYSNEKGSMMDYFNDTVECYGVADTVEQVKEFYKDQIASDAPIVISVTEIRKDNQPEDGGWRWHKWGQYIGTQEPQCEYIYDELEIDSVYVFHAYAVRPSQK